MSIAARTDEMRVAAMLLTRLPMGHVARIVPLASTGWAWPLVGAGVGLVSGLVLWMGNALGFGAAPAAVLAVAAGLLITGAMHEDGLSDLADGFGGGRDRAAKLAIMRDSRLGTYGAAALVLALVLRILLLADLTDMILPLVAAGIGSRAGLPLIQMYAPQARTEGLGALAGKDARPAPAYVALALGLLALLALHGGVGAILAVAAVQAGVVILARYQVGGVTGDVLGAAQLLGELAILLALTRI
ncbi:adenosylcobinamide-GDP ribazoletransferase [Falsirhodobacter sp. alg1]|uniref:adenosylcobinamide-GDP ribazoletransferase n=1 Tax=Falsirhodobacter sp. alg1 TaxID=1472418 RepID=UPI000788735D|nr:adenosylcobinamide-GDP ribazoletransferase [Falsirhodobacter sp. alg1]